MHQFLINLFKYLILASPGQNSDSYFDLYFPIDSDSYDSANKPYVFLWL